MPKSKTAQSQAETTEQHAPSGAGNKENTPLQFDVRIQSIRPGESIMGCRHRKDSRWRWQECNRIKPENIEQTAQKRSGRS